MNRPNITIQPSKDYPYWIERIGDFESAHQLDGHFKCGKLHGHSYSFIVIVQANTLTDDFGFVVDFALISEYFKQFDHSDHILKTSCEEFAEKACNDLIELMPIQEGNIFVYLQETAKSWAGFSRHFNKETEPVKPPSKLVAEAHLG